jgi:hypothetical protein
VNESKLLLAAIRADPLELTPQAAYRDWARDNPECIRVAIESAVAEVELLTAFGIGVGRVKGDTPETRQARFDRERLALFADADAFAASMAWLATRGKRRTVDGGSYGYKHDVERHWQGTEWPVYVPNGSFIAAVVCSGFTWKYDAGGPNVLVGISRRKPRAQ